MAEIWRVSFVSRNFFMYIIRDVIRHETLFGVF